MRFFFYNSAHYEPWDWRTPDEKGIGNSETCQVELSRILAGRGHEVYSFAPLPNPKPTTAKKVRWLPLEHAEKHLKKTGVWIVSRSPHFLDSLPHLPRRRIWFVAQDVEYGDSLSPERLAGIDRLIALCPEHSQYLTVRYPGAAAKINVSSNGARVDLIEEVERDLSAVLGARDGGVADPCGDRRQGVLALPRHTPRDPFAVAHASSPDRGLAHALHVFRRAREFEPRLTLHVAYGFDNLLKHSDRRAKKVITNLRKQLDQPGVINHGRLPQPSLYKLLLSCNLWLYPTDFQETGCASHLEAMCAGTVPIFSPLWAMEHNGGHGIAIPGDAGDPLTRCRFSRAILRLVWDAPHTEIIRQQMVPWAREQFSWERVADQYEMMAYEPGEVARVT